MTGHVYVISSGSYSDYQVHAVVDGTEQQAEELAARANAGEPYNDYGVESLPVVKPDVQQITVLWLSEEIWDNGEADNYYQRIDARWPWQEEDRPAAARWVRAPIRRDKGGRLDVKGTDHERVRKMFSDLRAALLTDDALRARREFRR